ncbi:hypothetical protein LL912_23465 [Niabella sp. CC-SYL272]|uniref:hypothetical protein n=1 Tax=Niabella agricola TaxID=2891571 RepID=UPI001F19ADE5|nr:hypothetical protein [Niabella agricola]MCF3111767.1 hypothetical protein [Niabella agricola]
MATDIGFEIRLIPRNGSLADKDIQQVRAICERAKAHCELEGLYGKYKFELRERNGYLSVELYGYYRGDQEDDVEALEEVLELTWRDEDNGLLIAERYFKSIEEDYMIRAIRDYW